MNIKVAAFTVSEKSSNTTVQNPMKLCGISAVFLFTVPFAIVDLDSQSHAS